MTRVDFYLLPDGADAARDIAVCRLTQKAFGLGHRVYILTGDSEQAGRLDRLLWTFHPGSFIPHALTTEGTDPQPPVLLGTNEPHEAQQDVLISLAAEVPEWFSRFQRVAEIVGPSDDEKLRARTRYRFYRDRGYALQTHNL
jgi:DNA polymerase-3 subunit chi